MNERLVECGRGKVQSVSGEVPVDVFDEKLYRNLRKIKGRPIGEVGETSSDENLQVMAEAQIGGFLGFRGLNEDENSE